MNMESGKPLDTSNATPDQKSQILRLATDVRKFEIGMFWQRSLFFWGFLVSAFTAYGLLIKEEPKLCVLIGCFGFVCSVAWTLQNRGSKYWQEAWEQKVERVEVDVLRCELFKNKEQRIPNGVWGGWRFSVSGLAIALSDFTVIIWSLLTVAAVPEWRFDYIPLPVLAVFLSLAYVFAMAWSNFRGRMDRSSK